METLTSSLERNQRLEAWRQAHTCSFGVPRIRKIWNSWSISESPYEVLVEKMVTDCNKTWKKGFPPIISATMAPRDQMSIGVEYLVQPSRISGALRRYLLKKSKDDMLRWGTQIKIVVEKGWWQTWAELGWSPVPQGDHLVSVHPDRNSEGPSESEVGNLDHLCAMHGIGQSNK